MWRIYADHETLEFLEKEHNVQTLFGPDNESYVCDFMFSSMIKYIIADGLCPDFRAEFVSDSEYTAMCHSFDFKPFQVGF